MTLKRLNHIEEAFVNRKKRYGYYRSEFSDVQGISLFDENEDASRNYAYFPILIETGYDKTRDEIYDLLRENNIYARKYFYPLTSDQACFKNKYRNDRLECARKLAREVLSLPIYSELEIETVSRIVEIIKS